MSGAAAEEKIPNETTTPPADGGAPPPKTGTPPASGKPAEGTPPGAGAAGAGAGTPDPDDKDPLGVYEDKTGKKFIKMPYDAFKERLGKSTKKALKELFGTSDKVAIAAIKKKYDELETDAKARQAAEMTEREKLEAEKKELLTGKEIAERRADRMKDKIQVTKTAQKMTKIAREHVHADKLDMALDLFKAAVIGMSKRAADKLVGKESEWFASFVTKNPDFAKAGAAEPDPKEKKPMSNGIDPKRAGDKPSSKDSGAPSKSVKDMTKAELAEYMREKGIKAPSLFG